MGADPSNSETGKNILKKINHLTPMLLSFKSSPQPPAIMRTDVD